MRSRFAKLLFGAVLLLGTAASCQRIPMYEAGSGVYLRLDLQYEPDINPGAYLPMAAHPELQSKIEGKRPELVRACFYDPESHNLVSEDFLPPEGGFVDISAGAYDVVVYSLGTEVTQIEGTGSRAGGYAFTGGTGAIVQMSKAGESGGSVPEGAQPVIYEPDHFFAGRIAGAVVPVYPDGEGKTEVLEATLTRVPQSWSIEILHIEGAENIASAVIYLTGQDSGRYLWDGRPGNHESALSFPLILEPGQNMLWTVFNTFGKYTGAGSDALVNVLVTTTGGGLCRFIFDVTDQFLNPDNTAHRIIIDEPFVVPGPDFTGGGVVPIVNEWGGDVIDVILE